MNRLDELFLALTSSKEAYKAFSAFDMEELYQVRLSAPPSLYGRIDALIDATAVMSDVLVLLSHDIEREIEDAGN
jgi:hypothetical protein